MARDPGLNKKEEVSEHQRLFSLSPDSGRSVTSCLLCCHLSSLAPGRTVISQIKNHSKSFLP